ncbi:MULTISPECIES: ABC transporter permease [unclassified Isoptericola]|uniref:ABC transporter permease n=1 Tax=unclassified Isoptericola TaxID=2623355 RepID=UPI003654D4A6
MSAVTAAPPVRRAEPVRGGSTLTGTWSLVRFILRRDRVRLLVWSLGIPLLYLGSLPEYTTMLDDAEGQAVRAALVSSPAMVAMTGPGYGTDHYTVGPALANELTLWVVIALAVMSILQVVRHTRAEEESSRSELVRAAAVGRHAAVVAALFVVVVVNAVIAVLSAAVLAANDLDVTNALGMTVGIAVAALTYGAVALVAAQVTEHSRGSTGLSMAVLGATFTVGTIGNMQEQGGSWASWLSPIGWAQQMRAFVDLRWWPAAIGVVVIVLLLLAASSLASRRDFGAGLVPDRPGRADALDSLRSPTALAWVQQRMALLWTALGLGIMWLAMGTVASQVPELTKTLQDNPVYASVLGAGDPVAGFLRIIVLYAALGAAVYGIVAMLRAKAEEDAGRAEYVLATPVTRGRWLGATLAISSAATVVVLVVGVAAGAAGAVFTGLDSPSFTDILGAGLLYLPALAVFVGFAAVVFAWAPRAATLSWVLLEWSIVVALFAGLFHIPEWAQKISPFWWVPDSLSGDVDWGHVGGLCAVAVVLLVLAFVGFRRRDVATK